MKDDEDFAGFPEHFRDVASRAVQAMHRENYVKGMEHYKEKNYPQAMEFFRLAAERAVADAEYQIGLMYFMGQGVPKSTDEAAVWFKRGAANGAFLATIYLELLKRNLDSDRQKIWLTEVFYNIGHLHFEEPAVREEQGYYEKDASKALDMLTMAASLGHVNALSKLGEIYEKGEKQGIPANPVVGLALVILLTEKSDHFVDVFERIVQRRSASVILDAIRLVRQLAKPGNFKSALTNYLQNPDSLASLVVETDLDEPASITATTDFSSSSVHATAVDTSPINQDQLQTLKGQLEESTQAVEELLKNLDWIYASGKQGASAGVLEAFAKHAAREMRARLGLQQ